MGRHLTSFFQQIEQEFHSLKYQAQNGVSENICLSLYARFLTKIQKLGPQEHFLSYYQELYEDYLRLFTSQNFQYRSAEFLATLKSTWFTMRKDGLSELGDPALQHYLEILELQELTVLLYTGDFETAAKLLNLNIRDFTPEASSNSLDNANALYDFLRQSGQSIPPTFDLIHTQWQELLVGDSDARVRIPVVERNVADGNEPLILATIQDLTVEVELRKRDAATDLIFFNNHPVGPNDPVYYQALDAVGAAKKHLKSKVNGRTPFFRVMFGFPRSGYVYTGESFGLGMSLATLCQMERVTLKRIQHKISNSVVVTGGVDVNGMVRAIAEESLPAKMEAFYNSPFQVIIYPGHQKVMIEKMMGELVPDPGKNTVSGILKSGRVYSSISADSLVGVLKNESAVRRIKITLKAWSQSQLRHSQLIRIIMILFMFVAVGSAGLYLTRDLNPVNALINNQLLEVYNAHGQPLWNYDFKYPMKAENYKLEDNVTQKRHLIITDLDGNGQNEVIIGLAHPEWSESGKIICFSARGEILWQYHLQLPLEIGDQHFEGVWNVNFMLTLASRSGNEQTLIAVFTHNPWYPCIVTQFSSTGEIKGRYFHTGFIIDGILYPPQPGVADQLVFVGTNNRIKRAMLGVLDLNHLEGTSPLPQEIKPEGFGQGFGLVYIRFPILNEFQLPWAGGRYNATNIRSRPDGGFLIVMSTGNTEYVSGDIVYELDADLRIVSASPTDSFFDHYKRLTRTDFFDRYSPDSLDQILRGLEYWDGVSWQPWN